MKKIDIKKTLKNSGLKVTKQRILILETLIDAKNPLSADDIFEIIKKKINVDLSTVYRNLNSLEEEGVLLKTNLENTSYYQINSSSHKHFITCSECNKKFTIDHCPVHELEEIIEKETGFIVNSHNFEFSGICPECQK